jgi:hypothetical protein
VQHCSSCGSNQLYARLYCTSCGSENLRWTGVENRGTLYTYTVVRRAPNAGLQARTPYIVALVDLDAGPRLMGNVDCPPERMRIGMPVRINFDLDRGAIPVPVLTPLEPDD